VLVSARSREGLAGLQEVLSRRLDLTPRGVTLRFDASEARAIAALYTAGRVLTHEVEGDEVRIEAEIPLRLVERYKERML
jgi:50S ribosomal subunit-associated GTPase HflX